MNPNLESTSVAQWLEHIVDDDFFSTVPGLNFDMCDSDLRLITTR